MLMDPEAQRRKSEEAPPPRSSSHDHPRLSALIGRRLRRFTGVLPPVIVDHFRDNVMLVVLTYPSVCDLTKALEATPAWKADAERVAAERAAQALKLQSLLRAEGVSRERAAFHDMLWDPPGDILCRLEFAAAHRRSLGDRQASAKLSGMRGILREAGKSWQRFLWSLPPSLGLGDSESMEHELGWYMDMVLASSFAGLVGQVLAYDTRTRGRRPQLALLKAVQLFNGGFLAVATPRDRALFRLYYVSGGRAAQMKTKDPVERRRHLRLIEKLDAALKPEAAVDRT
jgi:hypothetical protein